jgi:hypothetical protein
MIPSPLFLTLFPVCADAYVFRQAKPSACTAVGPSTCFFDTGLYEYLQYNHHSHLGQTPDAHPLPTQYHH